MSICQPIIVPKYFTDCNPPLRKYNILDDSSDSFISNETKQNARKFPNQRTHNRSDSTDQFFTKNETIQVVSPAVLSVPTRMEKK